MYGNTDPTIHFLFYLNINFFRFLFYIYIYIYSHIQAHLYYHVVLVVTKCGNHHFIASPILDFILFFHSELCTTSKALSFDYWGRRGKICKPPFCSGAHVGFSVKHNLLLLLLSLELEVCTKFQINLLTGSWLNINY